MFARSRRVELLKNEKQSPSLLKSKGKLKKAFEVADSMTFVRRVVYKFDGHTEVMQGTAASCESIKWMQLMLLGLFIAGRKMESL